MPMSRPPKDDVYYGFFKAKHTTAYLEAYLDYHRFAGQSLRDRITFGFQVNAIRKYGTIWNVIGNADTFQAPKVIVASGLTSSPNIPLLPGKEGFNAPVIHQEDFGQSSVLSAPHLKNVTVIGGGKSSADMTYACVKAGKTVTWIVRASGTGPGFFLSPKGAGPYKNTFEIGSTRISGTISPSVLAPKNLWTHSLHQTKLGREIVGATWRGVDAQTLEDADFDKRENALKGFENLRPKAP